MLTADSPDTNAEVIGTLWDVVGGTDDVTGVFEIGFSEFEESVLGGVLDFGT